MNGKSTAYRIALAQFVATLLVSLLLYALQGGSAAAAAGAGGGIAVVNNILFAWRVFGGGVVPAQTVLRRMYLAEVIKIFLTAALFLGALIEFKLPFLPLLLGYGVTLVVHWLSLLLPPLPAHRSS
jgi:ATP synthase protein I